MSTTELKEERSIFESALFEQIFSMLQGSGETVCNVQKILNNGMIEFVKSKTQNTEPLNEEALKIAFTAGIATVLGGDVCGDIRRMSAISEAKKRVIRKENLSGFNVDFEDGSKGGVIIPTEQYDKLITSGKTLLDVVNKFSEKKVSSAEPMDEKELNEILEISATKILEDDYEDFDAD